VMPNPSSHEVDHYKCYQVEHTPGAPDDPTTGVTVLHDQLYPNVKHTQQLVRMLCNPRSLFRTFLAVSRSERARPDVTLQRADGRQP